MKARRANAGTILLVATLLVLACIGLVLATGLATTSAGARADRASDRALAEAREALIAYAADRPINAVVGPGYLPCPDLDDDGWAESTCGSQTGDSGQADRLGRLPWKTLGIEDLRDGYGERLWYAVSSKYKGLLNCGVSRACLDMTPASALGTITVRDGTGAIVHDGTVAESSRASAGGAVAVVIAPGPALARVGGGEQARGCLPGECDTAGRCVTDPPRRAAHCDPANFLDRAPGGAFGGEDNADFADRNDAAGRPGNANGFIQGPVFLPDGRTAVNDRVVAIAYRDVMPRVMARVAREAARCLRQYATRPENRGRYPWPTPACTQSSGAWADVRNARFGRIPDTPFTAGASFGMLDRWWRAQPRNPESLAELPTANDACRIAIAPDDDGPQRSLPAGTPAAEASTAGSAGNSWWSAWKPYVFYALASAFTPASLAAACDASGCLQLVDGTGRTVGAPRQFAVIVAGAPIARGGLVQARAGAGISDPRQWLEDANSRLEGAAGCTPPPATTCEMQGACDRVATGADLARFNDVVVAYP
ncbi:MAG: hypothetical protein ACXWAU_14385 [Usitatibacter sp.]